MSIDATREKKKEENKNLKKHIDALPPYTDKNMVNWLF